MELLLVSTSYYSTGTMTHFVTSGSGGPCCLDHSVAVQTILYPYLRSYHCHHRIWLLLEPNTLNNFHFTICASLPSSKPSLYLQDHMECAPHFSSPNTEFPWIASTVVQRTWT